MLSLKKTFILLFVFFAMNTFAEKIVPLYKGIKSIEINLNGEKFTLMRNQKMNNKVSTLYDTTHRGFLQPIIVSKGVETIGEIEFIDYMKKAQTDKSIQIVDSRSPDWYDKLRIPGAINVPYTSFYDEETSKETMEEEFDVIIKEDESLDFSKAKTLVIYCNGFWCGQTPSMIKGTRYSLIKMGYPPSKIKYYRGGMQAWSSLGLTVVGDGK